MASFLRLKFYVSNSHCRRRFTAKLVQSAPSRPRQIRRIREPRASHGSPISAGRFRESIVNEKSRLRFSSFIAQRALRKRRGSKKPGTRNFPATNTHTRARTWCLPPLNRKALINIATGFDAKLNRRLVLSAGAINDRECPGTFDVIRGSLSSDHFRSERHGRRARWLVGGTGFDFQRKCDRCLRPSSSLLSLGRSGGNYARGTRFRDATESRETSGPTAANPVSNPRNYLPPFFPPRDFRDSPRIPLTSKAFQTELDERERVNGDGPPIPSASDHSRPPRLHLLRGSSSNARRCVDCFSTLQIPECVVRSARVARTLHT